jgi:hypothetical protein
MEIVRDRPGRSQAGNAGRPRLSDEQGLGVVVGLALAALAIVVALALVDPAPRTIGNATEHTMSALR